MIEPLIVLLSAALIALASAAVVLVRQGHQRAREVRREQVEAIQSKQLPPSLHPRIDLSRCIGSGACVAACPESRVLAVVDGVASLVNPTSCIGHGECARACPVDAITLVLGHPDRPVRVPSVDADFQTRVPGLYVAGELAGMGLIYNAMTQGLQAARAVARLPPARAPGVHQLAVVGAGPAGLAATLQAMADGLDVVTLDQDTVGGTVAHYPRRKLVMTRTVELPLYGHLRLGEIRKEALLERWQEIIDSAGLQVREGARVERLERRDGIFELSVSGGEPVRAQRVILALGRRGSPRTLGVPGEALPKVMYRLEEPEQWTGARCLVVGGGDSAVEAAIALGEAGAKTWLSYRRGAFGRIRRRNKERLDEAVGAGRVVLLMRSTVLEISPESVRLMTEEGEQALENDVVIICAGGVLPTAMLEEAGVEIISCDGEPYLPGGRL